MKQRLITSIFITLAVALAVASKFLPLNIGDYVFDIFVLVIAIVACFEMSSISEKSGKKINKFLVTMYPIFNYIVLLICLNFVPFHLIQLIEIGALLVYFVIILVAEAVRTKSGDIKVNSIASLNSIAACAYPGFMFCLMLGINHSEIYFGIPRLSVTFIALVFAITMLTDTLAYLVGSTLKGPKLAPKISPKKTISGAIGGIIGGVLGAMAVFWVIRVVPDWNAFLVLHNLRWWHFIAFGLVGSVLGQIGDLFESKIKRSAGVKDSGTIFPGHGGMFDRIDAMVFVVTFVYIILLIVH